MAKLEAKATAVAAFRTSMHELVTETRRKKRERRRERTRERRARLAAALARERSSWHTVVRKAIAARAESARDEHLPVFTYAHSSTLMVRSSSGGDGGDLVRLQDELEAHGSAPEDARALHALMVETFLDDEDQHVLVEELASETGVRWLVDGASLCIDIETAVYTPGEDVHDECDARLAEACLLEEAPDELERVHVEVHAALVRALFKAVDYGCSMKPAFLEFEPGLIRVRTAWGTLEYANLVGTLQHLPIAMLLNRQYRGESLAALVPEGYKYEELEETEKLLRVKVCPV